LISASQFSNLILNASLFSFFSLTLFSFSFSLAPAFLFPSTITHELFAHIAACVRECGISPCIPCSAEFMPYRLIRGHECASYDHFTFSPR